MVSALVLVGCATDSELPAIKYSGKHIYNRVNHLPSDYPIKHLPNGNIWPNFIQDMGLSVDLNNRLVHAQVHWWVMKKQGFLNNGLTRGAQYFYYIYQQTKLRHLPSELSLIPIFESSFVPVNSSHKGASGIWQFLPGTARGFGIRIDRWYDGRSDVIASTNAALKYLTYLYYFFDKDWLLAIAAYNWGPGNVQKAILRNKRDGLRADFWSLRMPQETKEYVPRLLALAAIIKNQHKYGVTIAPINNGPYFEAIRLKEQISLNKIVKLSGASEWTIRMLNAGYIRGVTYANGSSVVLVPRSKAEIFKAQLQGKTLAEPQTTTIAPPPVVSPTEVAKKTESEDKAKEVVNVTNKDIIEENAKNTTKDSSIDFETNSKKNQDTAPNLNERIDVIAKQDSVALKQSLDENESENNIPQLNKHAVTSPSLKQIKHVVDSGETLFSIARKYKTTTGALRRTNGLQSNHLKLRQTLIIPTTVTVTGVAKSEQRITAQEKTTEQQQTKPLPPPPTTMKSRPIIATTKPPVPTTSSKPVVGNKATTIKTRTSSPSLHVSKPVMSKSKPQHSKKNKETAKAAP